MMFFSLIGFIVVVVVVAILVGRWVEKSLWMSPSFKSTIQRLNPWFWKSAYRLAAEAILVDKVRLKLKLESEYKASLAVYTKDIYELEVTIHELQATNTKLYTKVYDVDGLEAQVADLKQVLEWTRTSLNEAKQETLEQMDWAHEDRERLKVSEAVRRDQTKSLRQRSTLIRELEEHIAERDNVITNLRSLLTLHKQASQRSALKFTRPPVRKKRSGI